MLVGKISFLPDHQKHSFGAKKKSLSVMEKEEKYCCKHKAIDITIFDNISS